MLAMLREHYSVDWKLVAESLPENRRELGRVAIRAVQLYADWLQRRQQVSPPALLAAKLGDGPLQVAAMGAPEMQPIKALNPSSGAPDRVSGPLQVAAQGMAAGSQTYSFTPTGESVAQLQRGPLSVAAMAMNEGIDSIGPEGRAGLARL